MLDKCRRLEQQLVQARMHVSSVKKELTNADATVSEHMKLAWEFENKCTTVHVLEATLSQINERVEGLTRSNKKLGKERDLSKNQVDELRSRLATIGQNAGADNKSASGNKHMENQLKDLALEFNNLKVDKLALEKQVERDNEVKVQLEESEQAVGRANTAYTMLESYFLEMNAELVQVEENKVKLEELMVKFEKINPGEPEARH